MVGAPGMILNNVRNSLNHPKMTSKLTTAISVALLCMKTLFLMRGYFTIRGSQFSKNRADEKICDQIQKPESA